MQKDLICQAYEDLESSVKLLEYSLLKYKPFDPTVVYSYEDLEYYDSLSFRFEKVVEMFLSFFKSLEIYLYGDLSQTIRQRLQRIEKLGIINNLEDYMEAKLLRNKVVHAYLPEKLEKIYETIAKLSSIFLQDFDKIKKYVQEEIKC